MRVAAAQAGSTAGDLAGNVGEAVNLVREAAAQDAALVLLPEGFLTGYTPQVFAGPLPTVTDPSWLDPLAQAARDHGIVVVAGTALARAGTRRLSLVVVDANGEVSAPYDKQHLVAEERDQLTAGDHGTSLVVDGFEFGLAICYDGCFPSMRGPPRTTVPWAISLPPRMPWAASIAATSTTPPVRSKPGCTSSSPA